MYNVLLAVVILMNVMFVLALAIGSDLVGIGSPAWSQICGRHR
jgi:hypothetical protein